MKKYIYYITLLAILLIIAVVLFMKDKKGTLSLDFNGFSVKDTSVVTAIRIQNNASTVVLQRKGSKWTVNQIYNANPRAIMKLLGTIRHFQISAPVPRKLKKEILQEMNDSATIVSIVSAGDVIKKYRIMDSNALQEGSVAMIDGENDPYVVNTAGFGGRPTVFFTTNTLVWRDRTIFHYTPDEIMAIEINYPDKVSSSFALSFLGDRNILLRSLATNKITKVQKDKAIQFLLNFRSVPFHWIFPEPVKSINDSISHKIPYCEIKVKNVDNQITLVKTFRIPAKDKPGEFNMDKMYAQFQDDSIPVIVKYIDIDPIMKEYADFAKP